MSNIQFVEPADDEGFVVRRVDSGAEVQLKLIGELDLAGVDQLNEAARHLPANSHVTIDMSELAFMDSSGIRVLMSLDLRSRSERWTLVLHAPQRQVFERFNALRIRRSFRDHTMTTSPTAGVERYRAEFPSTIGAVRAVRDEVASVARECKVSEATVQDIRLAVSEAATNSVIHGRAPADALLVVRVETTDDELCVVIADQGRGMLPRDDSPGLGLGLPIMSTVSQRVEVVSPGVDGHTEVHLYFALATC